MACIVLELSLALLGFASVLRFLLAKPSLKEVRGWAR